MMRKRIFLGVMLALAGLAVSVAALQREQQRFADKLIRLHVVANSDSREDQQIKLQVRDAVLAVTQGLSKEELACALPEIEAAAKRTLANMGREDTVRVSLGKERFPTRLYANFALPAGTYEALRVTIGAGAGRNWWCVAFPSICLRATMEELEEAAVSAGFTETELRLITTDSSPYVLKFKTLELLQRLKQTWFS